MIKVTRHIYQVLALLLLISSPVQAEGYTLTIQVIDSDKQTALDGLTITLYRAPEQTRIGECQLVAGVCQWQGLPRGIYEVAVAGVELDGVSQYAVAEGGLAHLGVTVGEGDNTYTLVWANGRLYHRDRTITASIQPFVPTLTDVISGHLPFVGLTSPQMLTSESEGETVVKRQWSPPPPTPTPHIQHPTSPLWKRLWPLWGFLLALGIGLFLAYITNKVNKDKTHV